MRLKLTRASINHGLIATGISLAACALSWFDIFSFSLLLCYAGSTWYCGREVTDIEKKYNWDYTRWNSAELLVPLLFNTVLLGGLYYSMQVL